MATKKTTAEAQFAKFARLMSKAVRLGHEHQDEKRAQATPVELAVELKMEPRSLSMLYLREAYLAGYNFVERD